MGHEQGRLSGDGWHSVASPCPPKLFRVTLVAKAELWNQHSCARTSCMAFEFNGNVTSVRLVEVNIDLGIGVMAPSPLS